MVAYDQGGDSHCLYSLTSAHENDIHGVTHLANCSRQMGKNSVNDTITNTSLQPKGSVRQN